MASKIDGPLVVIIDALNEADAPDLDNILCSQIPNLPGMFRVFVTCRPERRVLHRLGSDIPRHDFAIHQKENRKDIAIYVDHRLDDIAANHELKNWPTSKLKAKLLKRAEGLFIWVATICDYLLDQATYPDKKLERLLETLVNMPPLPPVKKMDSLYSTILETRNWDDEDFIEGYQQVLGVMVSQKMALNVDALQELHGAMPRVKAILTPLASLITGLTGFDQPAQILHGSFCEYITARATAPRYILPGSQNARLAVLCMGILNKMFSATIGGCGYMEIEPAVGIPDVEVDHFTEEQWYAARFWPAHIVEVVNPTEEVMGALREFLSKHLTTWIEVLASKSTYQSLIPVRKWLKGGDMVGYITNENMSKSIQNLLGRLTLQRPRAGEAVLVLADLIDMNNNRRMRPRDPKDPRDREGALANGEESDDSMPEIQSVSHSSDYYDSDD